MHVRIVLGVACSMVGVTCNNKLGVACNSVCVSYNRGCGVIVCGCGNRCRPGLCLADGVEQIFVLCITNLVRMHRSIESEVIVLSITMNVLFVHSAPPSSIVREAMEPGGRHVHLLSRN